MGVEGCTKCIKYMLFFLNFFFWLAGGVVLGVGLWLRHDNVTSTLLDIKYEGAEAPKDYYIVIHILIAVGAVMMVVGFLGCYGAIQESQCLLGTFFACLVILFACEVAAGIWGYMHRDAVAKKMITFYDSIYDKALKQDLTNDEKKQADGSILRALHDSLHCCGKGGVDKVLTFFTDSAGLTNICPDSYKSISCHERIDELFSKRIYLVGIAALVIAVIMIFEMIFSMVLCCGIRNSPVY